MTFSRIALKILKANIRRYLLLFLCGSFTILVFSQYATIYLNRDLIASFRSGRSMLYAPTLVIVLFSCFFMIHSHRSFARDRMREFGLFMTLGMTKAGIGRIVLAENGLISFLSSIHGSASRLKRGCSPERTGSPGSSIWRARRQQQRAEPR
jgi:hypothetical protein